MEGSCENCRGGLLKMGFLVERFAVRPALSVRLTWQLKVGGFVDEI